MTNGALPAPEAFDNLQNELEAYQPDLLSRPTLIAANKVP